MHALIESLLNEAPVVTDGAWGTSLQAAGLPRGACPDAWNLEHPERVEDVARGYVEAGSRIILSNTFGANRISLARHGLAEQAVAINTEGARISRRAAEGHARVFCSMGPTGVLVSMGEVPEAEVSAAFAEQAQALAQGGAEGLVIETMSDLTEARLALEAARTTGLPVVACMSFDSGPDKGHTMMGVSAAQAARELTALGADVVGANCGQGIGSILPVCQALRGATERPLWIKANAGVPRLEEGRTVYDMTPEAYAAQVPPLAGAGASFIGGCCGTTPDFIRAIAELLARRA